MAKSNLSNLNIAAPINHVYGNELWHSLLFFYGICRRSTSRHRALVLGTTILFFSIFALIIYSFPTKFRIQSRILTRQTSDFSSLTQRFPRQTTDYTRTPIEIMLSNDSISYVIENADLFTRWKETRTPIGKIQDYIANTIQMPEPITAREHLINTIRSKILAYTEGETIVVQTEWHDPEDCKKISEFIIEFMISRIQQRESGDAKATLEVISSSYEESSNNLSAAIADLMAHFRSNQRSGHLLTARAISITETSNEIKEIESLIESTEFDLSQTRLQIIESTNHYNSELIDFEHRIRQLNSSLGPNHPDYKSAIRQIDEQSKAPKLINSLRAKESELNNKLIGHKNRLLRATKDRSNELASLTQAPADQFDPEAEAKTRNVQNLIMRHNEIKESLEDAKTTIDSHLASLMHRFTITIPPRLPTKSASAPKLFLWPISIIASLFFSILVSVFIDIFAATIHEPWQIKETSGIECIGTLKYLEDNE